eukprot:1517587-Amphidinium_carterae.1
MAVRTSVAGREDERQLRGALANVQLISGIHTNLLQEREEAGCVAQIACIMDPAQAVQMTMIWQLYAVWIFYTTFLKTLQ